MDVETAQSVRPDPTKLYGICHDANGTAVVRVPRVIKVGLGMPKGRDIMVFLDPDGQWHVVIAKKDTVFKSQTEAESFYREQKPKSPEVNYPRKLSFFTFSRPAGDGSFDPDFETIKAHGAMPREIDIVFLDDRPLKAAYEMWSTSKLKCKGDGVNAMRVLEMASTEHEGAQANEAKKRGEKTFPIIQGCYTFNCPYAKSTTKGDKEYPAACKPHATIQFQLISAPRLGGICQLDTTSIRSISNLFSCLHEFYRFTGRGDPEKGMVSGIPLKLVLAPFKVNHNGQSGTAYSVSLEFRASSVQKLGEKLLNHAMLFREALTPPRQIEAPPEKEDPEDFEAPSDPETAEASAFNAEFVDETPQTIVKPGTTEAARLVAIHALAEEFGYLVEQVESCLDSEDVMAELNRRFGPPPKLQPPVAQRVAQETAAKKGAATTQAEESQPLFAEQKPAKEPTPISQPKKPFEGFGKKK